MISQRIEEVMKALNMNKNQFSKALGITNNVTIGRIINEGRTPSYDVLEKIIQTFGSINANWLMTGEGEMFKTTTNNDVSKPDKTNRLFINDKPASYEELLSSFTWILFQGYKSKYDTDIKFNTFKNISEEFEVASRLFNETQNLMETEIALNMYKYTIDSMKENDDPTAVIPYELIDIIDKYDQIYKDFMNENDAITRIMELTYKHIDTLIDIKNKISKNKDAKQPYKHTK